MKLREMDMRTHKKVSTLLAMLIVVGAGSAILGCKKKHSDQNNNQTSSGGSVPTPSPTTEQFELTVAKSGTGSGTITSNPDGLSCGSTCTHAFDKNTVVVLSSAAADGNSVFVEWTGACSGSGACSVTMDSAKSVTARFDKRMPEVTVSKIGDGDGILTSSPAGISCGTDCDEKYTANTVVMLTPMAIDRFSEFVGWTGDCSGTAACTLTVDHARNAVAEFRKIRKTVNVTKSGAGTGTVISNPAGISCGADCSENLLLDTVVTLTATPQSAASEFDHWTGDCSGSADCSVTMNDVRSVGAVFRIAQKTLTVARQGDGTGTVISVPTGISCGIDCAKAFNYGTTVDLSQVQTVGYFTGWSGACSGDLNCSVTMDAAKTVNAAFSQGSVDGDYCQADGSGQIFCFFVRSNAVVQTALGASSGGVTTTCRNNFFSGNTISNRAFCITVGPVMTGSFASAYRIRGHFDGSASPCSASSNNNFDYEVTRPMPVSSVSASAMSQRIPYDPNFKSIRNRAGEMK
jgi:hypothetical protein